MFKLPPDLRRPLYGVDDTHALARGDCLLDCQEVVVVSDIVHCQDEVVGDEIAHVDRVEFINISGVVSIEVLCLNLLPVV